MPNEYTPPTQEEIAALIAKYKPIAEATYKGTERKAGRIFHAWAPVRPQMTL